MKLRITTKLFLAVLAMATLVVVAMGAAAHWSLMRGFLGYVNEQSMQRLEMTLPRIAAAYSEHGSWDFVREDHHEWAHMLMPGPGRHRGEDEGPPPGEMPVSELTGANFRWALLDEQHQRITGYRQIGPDAVERPIVVDRRIVGYVAMAPFQSVAAIGAQRFERSQMQASLGVGALALALAALIAGWLSVSLLRPVQRVAKATGRLAAGQYDTRVVVRSHDEVGELATDFNHLAETLQKNADVRRSFFTDVSHELRTPLAILQGELEAIEDGVRPLTRTAVHSLLAEAKALSKLVAELHDFALAGSGSLSYRMQDTDVGPLLHEVLDAFSRRLQDHGLRLDARVADTALVISGDASRLRQVLHNLLENSIRYTDAGGTVRVRASSDAGEVLLCLDDSEPGVPEDELPLLFDRFYRADMPGARPAGSGLGLAICRAVVEAHRGTIRAGKSPLGGVRIEVRLPATP